MTMTTYKRPHDEGHSEALSYDRLEQPWRDWAKIARNFSYQLDVHWDREDLMHNIIVRLYEVAEIYRQQGKPLTKGGCIRVAQYTRLRFYHQKKRWKRVSSISLNGVIQDEEGYETERIQTLPAKKGIDLDTWLDAKSHYQSSPEKVKRAIRKLLTKGDGDGHRLSGHNWKLIKRFREEAKRKVAVG